MHLRCVVSTTACLSVFVLWYRIRTFARKESELFMAINVRARARCLLMNIAAQPHFMHGSCNISLPGAPGVLQADLIGISRICFCLLYIYKNVNIYRRLSAVSHVGNMILFFRVCALRYLGSAWCRRDYDERMLLWPMNMERRFSEFMIKWNFPNKLNWQRAKSFSLMQMAQWRRWRVSFHLVGFIISSLLRTFNKIRKNLPLE